MPKRRTFLDILSERLTNLPDASRLAIALDPKGILDLPSVFLDSLDRDWETFIYYKNDLKLRNFLGAFWKDNKRLLLVARCEKEKYSKKIFIDLSFIPDLIDEATEIIDCSPGGLLTSQVKESLPDDLFEEPLLSIWSDNINSFLRNLAKYKKIAGKGVALNKFDAMAIGLITSIPDIDIEEIANLPLNEKQRLVFYLKSIISHDPNDIEIAVLRKFVIGPNPDKYIEAWCKIERLSIIRFLYLGSVILRYAIPNGLEDIQRLGLLDFDVRELGNFTEEILSTINPDIELQRYITIETEKYSDLINDIDKLVPLFKFGSFEDILYAFHDEISPIVACGLGRRIIEWLIPKQEGLEAISKWQDSKYEDVYPNTPFSNKAFQYRQLISIISWLESTLKEVPNPPNNLLDLIDTYRASKIHLLELRYAEILECLRILKEKQIKEIVRPYLEETKLRIDSTLNSYDKNLALLISTNFQAYTQFPRLNTQILRNLIQVGTQHKEKVWIIILDGMRLDSWDSVVWPRLREIFEVDGKEQLYVATLPSYTDISRVAFFAGKLPIFWKDYNNNFTSDHNKLLSRHLVLGREESKKKIKIVARVEEKAEESDLDFGKAQYRCMIFNISDNWIHKEHGSLIRVNEIIKEKFEKMVLSELIYRIKPKDIVVVTSDHGFIELKDTHGIKIDIGGNQDFQRERINYRYIDGVLSKDGVNVDYGNGKTWTVAIGNTWFERSMPTGKRPRYTHGGVSMAEMVVPAVRLRKRAERKTEISISVDSPTECFLGDSIKLPIHLKNQGTIETKVFLECRQAGRLISDESIKLPENTSYTWIIPITADPKTNIFSIIAQYTLPNKKIEKIKRQFNLPIKDRVAKVEIDTSALDVFEDIEDL